MLMTVCCVVVFCDRSATEVEDKLTVDAPAAAENDWVSFD